MQLIYSPQKPTEPGWYWCKSTEGEAVVRIEETASCLMMRWLHQTGEGGRVAAEFPIFKSGEALWAGPIQAPLGIEDLQRRFWYNTKCQTCGKVNDKADDSSYGWHFYSDSVNGGAATYTCPDCPVLPGFKKGFER